MNREYFSVRAASEFCSLSQRLIYKLCQDRELKSYRIRRKILIKKSDLEALIMQGAAMSNDELRKKIEEKKR